MKLKAVAVMSALAGTTMLAGCDIYGGGKPMSQAEGQAKINRILHRAAVDIGTRALKLANKTGKGGIQPAILKPKDVEISFFVHDPVNHDHYSLMLDMKRGPNGQPDPKTTYDVMIDGHNDRNAFKNDFDFSYADDITLEGRHWSGAGAYWDRDPHKQKGHRHYSNILMDDLTGRTPEIAVTEAQAVATDAATLMQSIARAVHDPQSRVQTYREKP